MASPKLEQEDDALLSSLDAPQRRRSGSLSSTRHRWRKLAAVLGVAAFFGYLMHHRWSVIDRSREYHGIPSYEQIWEFQRTLPQHNTELAWPEGRNGRFVKFDLYHDVGFNNQLQDIIMVAQIAYMSNRAYAFQDYWWRWDSLTPVVYENGRYTSSRIPLNAVLAGPIAGGRIGPAYDRKITLEAPRFVTWDYYDAICPPERVTTVDILEVRKKYGIEEASGPSGKRILEAFADHLSKMNETCVTLGNAHLWTFEAFGARVVSALEVMQDSPILTKFAWSPLVHGLIARNLHHLVDDTQGTDLYSPLVPSSGAPKLPGLLAIHLRRGDFIEHCQNLYWWRSLYNSWNNLPELTDRFNKSMHSLPQEEMERAYFQHCLPTVDQLVMRIQVVRREWERSTVAHSGLRNKLKRVYLLTNAEKAYRDELKERLLSAGWDDVSMGKELLVAKDEMEVDMAADMMIGQLAEVFIGNGFSSLTANINLLRIANKVDPDSIRFL